ncbi:MAG: hypothetical protein ACREFN_02660, partial [Acetobacteraceae bacterium]
VHGRFESLVNAHIGAATAPIATRLRQGFVLPVEKTIRSLLPVLEAGTAGRRSGASVMTLKGADGYVLYGGYFDLMEGSYRVRLVFDAWHSRPPHGQTDIMVLEVISGSYYLAFRPVQGADLARGEITLDFDVTEQLLFHLSPSRMEVRLHTRGMVEARITEVTLEQLDSVPSASHMAPVGWLPLMFVGTAGKKLRAPSRWWFGRRSPFTLRSPDAMVHAGDFGVAAQAGESGCVVFGPYVSLLPGRHVLEVDLAPCPGQGGQANIVPGQIRLDVFCLADGRALAEMPLSERMLPGEPERLEFTVPDRLDSKGNPMQLEFRVWSSGKIGFTVRSVRTQPLSLLPISAVELESPDPGECGRERTRPP